MKFSRKVDRKGLNDVISQLSTEIVSLQQEIGKSIVDARKSDDSMIAEMKKSHVVMMGILSRLEVISDDIEELKKPWYSRMCCR